MLYRLYVSCQTRDGDLDSFFAHKNHAAPPSLSLGGKLRLGTKADLLCCLESEVKVTDAPVVNAKFLDGAAVVQMLYPETARTFQDYFDMVFKLYVLSQLETVNRVDVVWDVYIPESLKSTTRNKQGKGVRRRVLHTTFILSNWKDFLRVDGNKTELFKLLSEQLMNVPIAEGKAIYTTYGNNVLCSLAGADMRNLVPCSHEEADTCLLLHVADAVRKGCRKVCIHTVDTNVVVLAIAMLNRIKPDELWVALGTGSNFWYVPIHELAADIDPRICATLLAFHTSTGCDTVSSFGRRGKKTAWSTWKVYPEAPDAFEELLLMQDEISNNVSLGALRGVTL